MKECRVLRAPKPPLPPTWFPKLRAPLYRLVLSAPWQNAMLIVLVININTLALDYHGIETHPTFHKYFKIVADAFFFWYWMEFLIKFIGLGPGGYFSAAGRQFEFLMLMASVAERSSCAKPYPPTPTGPACGALM